MGKYIRRPREVEAILWDGTNLREVFDFFGEDHHPKFNEWFPTWEDFEKRVREDNWDFKIFGPGDEVTHVFPGSYIIKWGPGAYEAVNGLFFESEYVEAF